MPATLLSTLKPFAPCHVTRVYRSRASSPSVLLFVSLNPSFYSMYCLGMRYLVPLPSLFFFCAFPCNSLFSLPFPLPRSSILVYPKKRQRGYVPRCVPAVTHQPKHTGNQSAHALSSPLEHGSKMEKQIKETEKRRPKMPPVNQRSDSLFFFSIEEKQAKRRRCAFWTLSSVYTRDEHSAFFSSLPPFEWVLVSFFLFFFILVR